MPKVVGGYKDAVSWSFGKNTTDDPGPIYWEQTPTCPACGWRGVPTIIGGEEQPDCPVPGCKGQLPLTCPSPERAVDVASLGQTIVPSTSWRKP